LQYAVAGHHAAALRIEYRPVEDVSHRADHLLGAIAWQLRVGIKRDDVAYGREDSHVAYDQSEMSAAATQQGIELQQFATLALKTHPHAFARVPQARTVKEIEYVRSLRLVFLLEVLDAKPRQPHQLL